MEIAIIHFCLPNGTIRWPIFLANSEVGSYWVSDTGCYNKMKYLLDFETWIQYFLYQIKLGVVVVKISSSWHLLPICKIFMEL